MTQFCPYCESDLTDRDPEDYCCDGMYIKALREAMQNLCDYLFETGDNGDYSIGNWGDVNLEEMLPTINYLLRY
jgi:hypothetical protein